MNLLINEVGLNIRKKFYAQSPAGIPSRVKVTGQGHGSRSRVKVTGQGKRSLHPQRSILYSKCVSAYFHFLPFSRLYPPHAALKQISSGSRQIRIHRRIEGKDTPVCQGETMTERTQRIVWNRFTVRTSGQGGDNSMHLLDSQVHYKPFMFRLTWAAEGLRICRRLESTWSQRTWV